MNVRACYKFFLGGLLSLSTVLTAAPKRSPTDEGGFSASLREMRDSLTLLRHEVNNHELEMRMFDERVNNQESALTALHDQIAENGQQNKDYIKNHTDFVENKFAQLESAHKSLMADLRQLKTHANDSATVLAQYQAKIGELEEVIASQNQNIMHLQAALQALMEALNPKETPIKGSSPKIYQVKPGDSLDKIAKNHHTSVKAIKERNHLTSDKITVNQRLELP